MPTPLGVRSLFVIPESCKELYVMVQKGIKKWALADQKCSAKGWLNERVQLVIRMLNYLNFVVSGSVTIHVVSVDFQIYVA